MIYLICARDSKQRVAEINDKDTYKDNIFYKYLVESFEHKNVLYPIDFYNQVIKEVLPNRVNIIYTLESRRRLPNIFNGIVLNTKKDIYKSYKNDIDDVYVFATHSWIIEEFYKIADYLIIFASDEIGFTMKSLPDLINLATFDLIRTEKKPDLHYNIEYYVCNKLGK